MAWSTAWRLIHILFQQGDVMRNLAVGLLALALATPVQGQQVAPSAFTMGSSAIGAPVAFRTDSTSRLSLGSHALAGSLIGMLVAGGVVAVAMLVESSECICNPILIALPAIGVGGAAGALTGMVVYAGRKAHARSARAQ